MQADDYFCKNNVNIVFLYCIMNLRVEILFQDVDSKTFFSRKQLSAYKDTLDSRVKNKRINLQPAAELPNVAGDVLYLRLLYYLDVVLISRSLFHTYPLLFLPSREQRVAHCHRCFFHNALWDLKYPTMHCRNALDHVTDHVLSFQTQTLDISLRRRLISKLKVCDVTR